MLTKEFHRLRRFREEISGRDIAGILIGAFLQAVAIQFIVIPAKLLTGGITGIAIILNLLTPMPVWSWYLLMNIPIFIAGYRYVSSRFFFYSLLGTGALSLFLMLLAKIPWALRSQDIIPISILGGFLMGAGVGTVLKSKGSCGGFDIIAVLVKRYGGYSLGESLLFFNLVIIGAFAFMENVELAFYSAVTIYSSSKVVDAAVIGIGSRKSVWIVSDYGREIANEIVYNMHRGCTFVLGEGVYTGAQKKIIMSAVGKRQLPRLKEIVFTIDPNAFLTISESLEVYGKGFSSSKADF